jgi:hypothetical protein
MVLTDSMYKSPSMMGAVLLHNQANMHLAIAISAPADHARSRTSLGQWRPDPRAAAAAAESNRASTGEGPVEASSSPGPRHPVHRVSWLTQDRRLLVLRRYPTHCLPGIGLLGLRTQSHLLDLLVLLLQWCLRRVWTLLEEPEWKHCSFSDQGLTHILRRTLG